MCPRTDWRSAELRERKGDDTRPHGKQMPKRDDVREVNCDHAASPACATSGSAAMREKCQRQLRFENAARRRQARLVVECASSSRRSL